MSKLVRNSFIWFSLISLHVVQCKATTAGDYSGGQNDNSKKFWTVVELSFVYLQDLHESKLSVLV